VRLLCTYDRVDHVDRVEAQRCRDEGELPIGLFVPIGNRSEAEMIAPNHEARAA
jgi:hypothetical protein